MNATRIPLAFSMIFACSACEVGPAALERESQTNWLLVDDLESGLAAWTFIDVDNNTDPFVPDPQVAEIRGDTQTDNNFLLRKPAADGIVGNRKAIGFRPLPFSVAVGDTVTFYTRINVEYFPNNHSFGLTNVAASDIPEQNYNAFEPMIRVTDKAESNGSKNDGTLMVLSGDNKAYSKINNPATGESAKPLEPGNWYEVWWVVNNAPRDEGGQRYDLYVRGGEFETQQRGFENADFRMRRAMPLSHFMTICNTGPADKPYGNGGLRYDDIYMVQGRSLASPLGE